MITYIYDVCMDVDEIYDIFLFIEHDVFLFIVFLFMREAGMSRDHRYDVIFSEFSLVHRPILDHGIGKKKIRRGIKKKRRGGRGEINKKRKKEEKEEVKKKGIEEKDFLIFLLYSFLLLLFFFFFFDCFSSIPFFFSFFYFFFCLLIFYRVCRCRYTPSRYNFNTRGAVDIPPPR